MTATVRPSWPSTDVAALDRVGAGGPSAAVLAAWKALPAIAAIWLAGCASTPAPVLLTLPPAVAVEAPAPANATTSLAGARPVLALRRIEIPEYLVARRVRYRADASTLVEWPNTYWAERVEIGVSREFAAALQQALPAWQLCEVSCAEQSPAFGLQVEFAQLDFLRTERRLQARVRLSVWSGDAAPRLSGRSELNYSLNAEADTPQAQALVMTGVLRRAATDAAALVRAGEGP